MTKERIPKTYPRVGDKLYLQQRTGSYYVDLVKRPYTVIGVTPSVVRVQACELIFNGPRYFDTLPDAIKADPEGEVLELHWAPSKGMWQIDKYKSGYPEYAHFGNWEYYPYLD